MSIYDLSTLPMVIQTNLYVGILERPSALELNDAEMDAYLDFCEKALLPHEDTSNRKEGIFISIIHMVNLLT